MLIPVLPLLNLVLDEGDDRLDLLLGLDANRAKVAIAILEGDDFVPSPDAALLRVAGDHGDRGRRSVDTGDIDRTRIIVEGAWS